MKIALFGATGQTGFPLLCQALANTNIHVKAIVRNVEKLKTSLKKVDENISSCGRLSIVEISEDLHSDNFAEHLTDVEVVISTLGFGIKRPSTAYVDFTKSVVTAMNRSASCRRLVLMHSWYTEPSTRSK